MDKPKFQFGWMTTFWKGFEFCKIFQQKIQIQNPLNI